MADNSPLLRTWSGLLLVLTLVFGGFQSAVAAATADGYHVDAYAYDDQPHTAGLADSGGPLNQKLDSASATASADRGVRVEEIETASWAGLRQRSAFVAPRGVAGLTDDVAGVAFRSDTSHIFRDSAGHLLEDTATNRSLIQSAIEPGSLRSTITLPDGSSLAKYFRTLPDGTQVWAEVRNGVEITNGGLNAVPR
jgi:hypothetical protein